jgi:hypothetical protein
MLATISVISMLVGLFLFGLILDSRSAMSKLERIGVYSAFAISIIVCVASFGAEEYSRYLHQIEREKRATHPKNVERLARVRHGVGISEAKDFVPSVGPHRIIIIRSDGTVHDADSGKPSAWTAELLSDLDMVAILTEVDEQMVVAQHTHNPSAISPQRFEIGGDGNLRGTRRDLECHIYLAKTGQLVAGTTLRGTEPGFRETRVIELTSDRRVTEIEPKDGYLPSNEAIFEFLAKHMDETRVGNWLTEPMRSWSLRESDIPQIPDSPEPAPSK